MKRGYVKSYEITELTDFIRGELKRQRITQREAAEFLNLTQGMLSRKLKNGSLSVKELKQLRDLLNISRETIARYL